MKKVSQRHNDGVPAPSPEGPVATPVDDKKMSTQECSDMSEESDDDDPVGDIIEKNVC